MLVLGVDTDVGVLDVLNVGAALVLVCVLLVLLVLDVVVVGVQKPQWFGQDLEMLVPVHHVFGTTPQNVKSATRQSRNLATTCGVVVVILTQLSSRWSGRFSSVPPSQGMHCRNATAEST